MQAEDWKGRAGREEVGMKDLEEELEGRREGGKGSLCGFESTVQRLPDKLVFPGTPQEHSARKRIMLCTNLSEIIFHTSLSVVLLSCLSTAALWKHMPTVQYTEYIVTRCSIKSENKMAIQLYN